VDPFSLRALDLFEGLADEQLGELAAMGTELSFSRGEELFREGAPADFWWVLLDGCVDLVRHVGRQEMLLGRMDVPGRWAGGFRAWDENGVYLATGRAGTPGRVLRVPAEALRSWSVRWFRFGNHILEGLFRTARRFESLTREKESLIALGTLAAGLAHEINNPASAATRAAEALGRSCETLLGSLRRLAANALTAEQFTALDRLRTELEPPPVTADPMEAADREQAVSGWLSDQGVARPWSLAPALTAAGADVAWCEAVSAVLGPSTLEPGLEWIASTLTSARELHEVRESTGRISALVAAVKSYSELDRAPVHPTDVAEGLESTLVMLAHRVPPGVDVVRDYGDGVPRIDAVAAELNQVWTNLVTNALDAMGDRGTLRVSTRPDADGGVVAEVADTGDGMNEEVAKHAFDPFFTTKPVGQGTGLGLDIVRRIVDRHGGAVAIDSRPGATVLRVRLRGTVGGAHAERPPNSLPASRPAGAPVSPRTPGLPGGR
jgi:signal transduction histidine kinase